MGIASSCRGKPGLAPDAANDFISFCLGVWGFLRPRPGGVYADAFVGLGVEQQQRCAIDRLRTGAERTFHRQRDRGREQRTQRELVEHDHVSGCHPQREPSPC